MEKELYTFLKQNIAADSIGKTVKKFHKEEEMEKEIIIMMKQNVAARNIGMLMKKDADGDLEGYSVTERHSLKELANTAEEAAFRREYRK